MFFFCKKNVFSVKSHTQTPQNKVMRHIEHKIILYNRRKSTLFYMRLPNKHGTYTSPHPNNPKPSSTIHPEHKAHHTTARHDPQLSLNTISKSRQNKMAGTQRQATHRRQPSHRHHYTSTTTIMIIFIYKLKEISILQTRNEQQNKIYQQTFSLF